MVERSHACPHIDLNENDNTVPPMFDVPCPGHGIVLVWKAGMSRPPNSKSAAGTPPALINWRWNRKYRGLEERKKRGIV